MQKAGRLEVIFSTDPVSEQVEACEPPREPHSFQVVMLMGDSATTYDILLSTLTLCSSGTILKLFVSVFMFSFSRDC